MQLRQQQGETVDAARLVELMEATRPKGGDQALPDWYIVAECMRNYHWTERQFWEDNSTAMIFRLIWLERVYSEKQDRETRKGPAQFGGPNTDQGGRNQLAPVRPRGAPVRR